MRKTLYLLLIFVFSFTSFTFGIISLPNQSYAEELKEKVDGATVKFVNGSIGRLYYDSGTTKSFTAKGNQVTVKVKRVNDSNLFRNAPRVNAHLQQHTGDGKYRTIDTIEQMAKGQTRVFKKLVTKGKRYRIKFTVKKTHPDELKVFFRLYQKQVSYRDNHNSTPDNNSSNRNNESTTNNTSTNNNSGNNSTQSNMTQTSNNNSNFEENNIADRFTGDTQSFKDKEGEPGRKTISKANGNPIKIKIDNVKNGWGAAPNVNIHLQEYQGAGKGYKTVQTRKDVAEGETRAFTKGIKQGKRYRFYFTLDKDSPKHITVSYIGYQTTTDNITDDYKFYPTYNDGELSMKVKQVSNTDKTPKLTGEARYQANNEHDRIYHYKWDKPYELPDLKMPEKGKEKSVKVQFIGLKDNEPKPVRIGHNITLKNKKGDIDVSESTDDGKLEVKGTLPDDFKKSGTWQIKLVDQADDKTIDEVRESHDKQSFTHEFNASDVENKNYKITITYSANNSSKQTVTLYSGSGSKEINNITQTTTPSPSTDTSNNSNNQNDSNGNNNDDNNDQDNKDDSEENQDKKEEETEVQDLDLEVDHRFNADGQLVVDASVADDVKVDGDWTFSLVNTTQEKKGLFSQLSVTFGDLPEADDNKLQLKVEFDGELDGKEAKGSIEKTIQLPDENQEEQCKDDENSSNNLVKVTNSNKSNCQESDNNNQNNQDQTGNNNNNDQEQDEQKQEAKLSLSSTIVGGNQVEIYGTVENANNPQGTWKLTFNNEDPKTLANEDANIKETFSTTDITQQSVPVTAEFAGRDADGKEVKLKITENLSVKSQTTTEEEQVIEEVTQNQKSPNGEKVGGRLPDTATSYGFGIIGGLLLLAGGLVTLWIRRRHS